MTQTQLAREWADFTDPKDPKLKWHIDVTFLLSHWQCIFGQGCQGVLTEPTPELNQGCCSYGAHFSDRKDRDRVVRAAKNLTEDEWQFAKEGKDRGIYATFGKASWRTRLVDDACIFLNRPGFPAGAGCALHLHSLNTDEHFMETKPEVCWQLPLRRIDEYNKDDTVTATLTEFARDGWGEGGEDFAWWCTEDPAAFTAREPVYKTLSAELEGMLGKDLYKSVVDYLSKRERAPMPASVHPSAKPVTLKPTRNNKKPARAAR